MTPHIVWDWNGTLFDDWDAVYRASCELFAARGLPAVTAEQYRAAYTRPITAFYARLFGREPQPSEFAGMDREFHAAYERAMPRVTLAGDARETLRAWRAAGGSQSLLSMFRHERLLELVRRFELEPEFVRVDGLTGPGGGRKAEHLDRHLRRLRLDPAGVTLVGDSLDDAAAAEDTGARCVLYDGGSHPRETLAATGLPVAGTLAEALSWAA